MIEFKKYGSSYKASMDEIIYGMCYNKTYKTLQVNPPDKIPQLIRIIAERAYATDPSATAQQAVYDVVKCYFPEHLQIVNTIALLS